MNGDTSSILSSAEVYDPASNSWSVIKPMWTKRSDLAVVALGENIYALGGFDGSSHLNSVEAYDPASNSWWSPLKPMMGSKRSGLAAVVF